MREFTNENGDIMQVWVTFGGELAVRVLTTGHDRADFLFDLNLKEQES